MRDEKLVAHEEMVNRVGNLQEQNDRLRKQINLLEIKQKNHYVILMLSFSAAAVLGWTISYLASPAISARKDCYVYKVAKTPVTAFVLKPPAPLHIEAPACPVPPKFEIKEENETPEEQKINAEQELPHRKRHRRHRIRSRWR